MIACTKIEKIYQTGDIETRVLRQISFTIAPGEFVAIMGPSGSGKSTLMHILGCLDAPTTGKYVLDGIDTSETDDDTLADIRLRKIGFVFQAFNLLPRATVIRNVMLPLVYGQVPIAERHAKAEGALRGAAFPEKFWEYKSNQLSGGMTQRVAIARALVNDPAIILADEPTGNLDSKTGEQVMGTFQHLHEKLGRTIVLITHEADIAEYAERIIQLKDGEIIKDMKTPHRRISTATL